LKKLPVIGLIIGAIAAVYLKMKGKKPEPEVETYDAPAPATDTNPPA
jgi:hypothetical protein